MALRREHNQRVDEALILLGLRLLAAGALLAFIAAVVYYLRRDFALLSNQSSAPRPNIGRLVVVASEGEKPQIGERVPLSAATTLGRAETNSLQIDDRYASNQHARVVQRMGQWWLEDQKSSNGTQLNGVPIDEPVVLSSGDVISIGAVQLRLELE